MPAPDESRPLRPTLWAAAALAFCLLATLNAGGYRFGVADQAFYLPAIQRHLVPDSFPRDRIIIDDQDRLNVFTRALAGTVRVTGVPVDVMWAAMFGVTLVVMFGGALAVARGLGASAWAQLGLAAALTLRHRVGITGVNTLESYGHPRLLAFAIGLWAVAAVLRGRTYRALLLVAAAFVVHPTTAVWIGIWVGVASIVNDRPRRPWLLGAGLAAAAAAWWAMAAGPLRAHLVRMDAEWLGVLGGKDYLFPTSWPAAGWLMAAMYVLAVVGPFLWRRRQGVARPAEAGLVVGAVALFAVFLATLPATAAGIALAVQFQISRVFWVFDFLGTVYVVMLVVDGARAARGQGPVRVPARRAAVAFAVLATAAAARGVYVKWIEHPERPVARLGLRQDDWQDALNWLARTPADSYVLADPGHAWRHGVSVRVGAGRDVLLEEVKDTAMSMYSRRVAMHVLERIRAIGGFDRLGTDEIRALAARYDLDYLVAERPFDLPVAYRNGRFAIYSLADGRRAASDTP